LFSYEKYVRNVLLFFSEKRYVLVYREMETLVESNGNFHDAVTDNVELTDSAIGKYFILLFPHYRPIKGGRERERKEQMVDRLIYKDMSFHLFNL
jgi:hypothetical protein